MTGKLLARTDPRGFNHARHAMRHLRRRLLRVGVNPHLIRAEASDPIAVLQEQIASAQRSAANIQAQADAEGRAFTPDEERDFRSAHDTVARITDQITLRQNMAELNARVTAPVGRRTVADGNLPVAGAAGGGGSGPPARTGSIVQIMPNRDPRAGFAHFGEYLSAVRMSSGVGASVDERLRNMQATLGPDYGNETTGGDGGFAVPPDFRSAIWQKVMAQPSLLSMCDLIPTASNNFTVPKDNVAPWDDTTGIRANWTGEAAAKAQSKPDLDTMTVKLNKLTVLVPMTDELLDDAPAMNAYVTRKAADKIDFKVSLAIVDGTGTGQPLGILRSPARVTVARLTGEGAGALIYPNVNAMWAHMAAQHRPGAVWLVHPMVDEQLPLMAFTRVATEPANPIPVYLPANSIAGNPYATLYGRPVITTECCNALGTEGDIIFTNLSQYLALTKGGVRQDVSIHVYFENDVTAFRFVLRIGGRPWWDETLASRVGPYQTSPYVTLGAPAP
jgi:HK97 family phage major capsid protein